MATITKTIGAAGDYTTPALAAAAFNAGTVSGATSGDDIVFSIIDNASFASTFRITANPATYLSVTLTAASGVRHNGLPGTGARITRASGNDTDTNALVSSTLAIDITVSWLEVHYAGSGKGSDLIRVLENTTTKFVNIHHCLLHDSGGVTGYSTVRGILIGARAVRIHNNIIYNIIQPWALAGAACIGVFVSRSTPNIQYVLNNTIYNVSNAGSNTTAGFTSFAVDDTGRRLQNNIVIGTTSAGVKNDIVGHASPSVAIINHNATTDSTAIGTGSLTGVTQSIFRNTAAGNLLLAAGASVFAAGTDLSALIASVPELGIDITGRDRVASGDTWSMGASQVTDAPVNAVTLTSPTSAKIYQRNGSNQASVTVSGTYTGTPTTLEYSFAGGAYSTLVASPSGGAFSETLTLSGQGSLSVRFSNDVAVSATATNVGIGDIFIVAGQSNASGRLTNIQTYSHATLVPVVYDQDDLTWRVLTDPTDPETALGSIWPLLSTLFMADQSVPVGFITVAEGGTSLTGDWKPTVTVGTKYSAAVSRINGLAPGSVKAMIWDQGESDANTGVTKADYNVALDALAANLQTATGLTFPTICDLVGNGSATGLDAIRQAQIEAWDDNADIYPGANSIARRALHWETNTEGATHAALLWVAMDEALYGGPSARGPRLVSAVTIGGTSTVVLTFDRDLLASDSTYTASAFAVSHSGTARTISSVARTGTRTVQLSLSGPLDGTSPTVTFASGQTAANATVPRTTAIALPATIQGISSISVPAEPIYAAAVTVNAPDTTAPVIASASVNTAGDTLTVSFTEVDSPPLLPSSAATGITLSSTGASVTVSNGTRQSDLVYTFPLSRTIYSNETLLVSYSQSSGNITDSAVPTANEVPDTSNFAATNNSTQTPTISSVSTDAIVLVGTASTITWSSAGVIGTVDIVLSLDNGSTFPITIMSGTTNDGSHSWTPEAAQLTAQGVIRVRSTNNNSYQGTRNVKVATTEATGAGSNTAEWSAVREMLASAGVEVVRV